jgi:hypothetical protein
MKTLKLTLLLLLAASFGIHAQTQLPALPPDGFVTLQQIVNDFSTAPDAALQKYSGLRILVYGRVDRIQPADDLNEDPLAVIMQLPNQSSPDVKAVFSQDQIDGGTMSISGDGSKVNVYHRDWAGNVTGKSAFVESGDMVGIRGTFDNQVAGEIVLKNCFKLSPEALNQKLAEHGIPTE